MATALTIPAMVPTSAVDSANVHRQEVPRVWKWEGNQNQNPLTDVVIILVDLVVVSAWMPSCGKEL